METDGPLTAAVAPAGYGPHVRVVANDDRSIVIHDSIRQTLRLDFGASLSIAGGAVEASITGGSEIDGIAHQFVAIREQVSLVDRRNLAPVAPAGAFLGEHNVPQTNVLVTPEVKYHVDAKPLSIRASFKIDVGAFDFEIERELYKESSASVRNARCGLGTPSDPVGTPVNCAGEIYPERARLRAGEFTDAGLEFFEPLVATVRSTYSHLPATAGSFPPEHTTFVGPSRNVGECLLEPPADVTLAPPEPPTPSETPPGQSCVYGFTGVDDEHAPLAFPEGFDCSPQARADFLAGLPDQELFRPPSPLGPLTGEGVACVSQLVDFLCTGDPPNIEVFGALVVSRFVDMAALDQAAAITRDVCMPAFMTSPDPATRQRQGEVVWRFLDLSTRLRPCDAATGELLGEPRRRSRELLDLNLGAHPRGHRRGGGVLSRCDCVR